MSDKAVILAVDDSTESLKLLGAILTEGGYQTRLADSGVLALESLNSVIPNLILLDINMPDIDGYEVCRRLKAEPRTVDIPVIFISAENETLKQIEGFRCGAVDFVTKPFNTEVLLTRVKTHLELNLLRCQAEDRLREMEREQIHLIHLEKMASIGQLAAGVAHEINNPLGFVVSNMITLGKYIEKYNLYIDMIEQELRASNSGLLSEKVQTLRQSFKLDYIMRDINSLIVENNEGLERINSTVQNLQTFSSSDASTYEKNDLNRCLDSTINIISDEVKYAAELKCEFSELPRVFCNFQQISQVVMNLLINAAHAIKSKGDDVGTITIRTWCNDDNAFVSVSDNGLGIDSDHLNKIFDAFYTTREIGKGAGLGLSVAANIVKNHGGDIMVASESGVGSTFTVRLPLKQREKGETEGANHE